MAPRSPRAPNPQLSLFGPPEGEPEPAEEVCEVVGAAAADEELLKLSRALPATILLGGSTWSFPGWEGWVYDRRYTESRLARQGLRAYARHPLLRAVGIDRTHYAPLSASDFAEYAAAVPDGFRFLVKAYDALTLASFPDRLRYGAERGKANPHFLAAAYAADTVVAPFVEGLGEKGGALLFQFAPQALGGPDRFAARLADFLGALPSGPLYAVEVRNRELLAPPYIQALAAAGACHCYNVLTRMPDLATQARFVPSEGWPATIVRWLVAPGLSYEDAGRRFAPFDRMQAPDPATRRAVAALARDATAAGRPFLCTINNNAEGCAPASIIELAREIVSGPA
jgi:uncharacterized protein YecE (DUF72 family)